MSYTRRLVDAVPAEFRERDRGGQLRFLLTAPGILAVAIPSCILLDLHAAARGDSS